MRISTAKAPASDRDRASSPAARSRSPGWMRSSASSLESKPSPLRVPRWIGPWQRRPGERAAGRTARPRPQRSRARSRQGRDRSRRSADSRRDRRGARRPRLLSGVPHEPPLRSAQGAATDRFAARRRLILLRDEHLRNEKCGDPRRFRTGPITVRRRRPAVFGACSARGHRRSRQRQVQPQPRSKSSSLGMETQLDSARSCGARGTSHDFASLRRGRPLRRRRRRGERAGPGLLGVSEAETSENAESVAQASVARSESRHVVRLPLPYCPRGSVFALPRKHNGASDETLAIPGGRCCGGLMRGLRRLHRPSAAHHWSADGDRSRSRRRRGRGSAGCSPSEARRRAVFRRAQFDVERRSEASRLDVLAIAGRRSTRAVARAKVDGDGGDAADRRTDPDADARRPRLVSDLQEEREQ